jgi:hypothetical protein
VEDRPFTSASRIPGPGERHSGCSPRMAASPAFDLSIAEVISYESLTIVVFECECRWVVMLDRGPMVVACPGHGLEPNGNRDV